MKRYPFVLAAALGLAVWCSPLISAAAAQATPAKPGAQAAQAAQAERKARQQQLQKRAQEMQQAQQYRKLVVPAEALNAGVEKLTKELKWNDALDKALAEARKANKPVLWIQALGELNGFI